MRREHLVESPHFAVAPCLGGRIPVSILLLAAAVVAAPPAVGQELQSCAYLVYPGSWLDTGFQVKAGQVLEIQASGTNRYKEGARVEFGVGGDMYGVWSLTAKVGSQIEDLDGGAIFTAEQNGVLELGVPAKADLPVEESGEYLDPEYSLCVNVHLADHGGGLSIALEDCPREVWVGWGRPSMACVVCIRGFRTNTPDPVVLDCPGAYDEWGDHADAGGERLKTIRIFACGASALTYDWAGQWECPDLGPDGYPWGIFVSAPAEDLVNHRQPGRRAPECLGTNPVRLRVSQGDEFAEVTLAPEIVLTQGGVGGGGSYENWTECGDDGGGVGGGGGGGAGGCGLGRWWEESENIWTGTWTRRGGSSVFDGHWETPGYPPIDNVLTISTNQNQVHVFRQDPNIAGNTCEYDGTISPDGRTVSGSYSCNDRGNFIGPVPWSATIHCD